MQLSELKQKLEKVLDTTTIGSFNKNQTFSLVDSHNVAYCDIEYNVHMGLDTDNFTQVNQYCARTLFQRWVSKRKHNCILAYQNRVAKCVEIHDTLEENGYTLQSSSVTTHVTGDVLYCYYTQLNDHNIGGSVEVMYTPTEFLPEGKVKFTNEDGEPTPGVYYAAWYEHGELIYVACKDIAGKTLRKFELAHITGHVPKGRSMQTTISHDFDGFAVLSRITEIVDDETPEARITKYIGELSYTDEKVMVTVTDFK